jgi:hypothetical protein
VAEAGNSIWTFPGPLFAAPPWQDVQVVSPGAPLDLSGAPLLRACAAGMANSSTTAGAKMLGLSFIACFPVHYVISLVINEFGY